MRKIGLALGGGAALGAAHVGVLRAIKEQNIQIDYITGTSIGAMAAAFYAFGKSWKEIQEITEGLAWLDISHISLTRFGLLNNDEIGKLLKEHIGDKNVEDANIPLAIVTTDISTGKKFTITQGPLAEAVTASTCIPGIFHPREFDDVMLVDGGLIENVPIPSLKKLGATYTIAVDLNAHFTYKRPTNIMEMILNSFHLMMAQNDKKHTAMADIVIQPNLSEYTEYDLRLTNELIQIGYETAIKSLKNIHSNKS